MTTGFGFCFTCGTPRVAADQKFCAVCGANFSAVAPPAPPAAEVAAPAPLAPVAVPEPEAAIPAPPAPAEPEPVVAAEAPAAPPEPPAAEPVVAAEAPAAPPPWATAQPPVASPPVAPPPAPPAWSGAAAPSYPPVAPGAPVAPPAWSGAPAPGYPPGAPGAPGGQPAWSGAPAPGYPPVAPGAPAAAKAGFKITQPMLLVGALVLVVIVGAFIYMSMSSGSGGVTFTPSNFSCSGSNQITMAVKLPSSLKETDQLTWQLDGVTDAALTSNVATLFTKQSDGSWAFSTTSSASTGCQNTSGGPLAMGAHTIRILDATGKVVAEGSFTLTP